MKLFNQIRDYFDHFKSYLETEKEVLKLKAVKAISSAIGNFMAAIFMIILFHIMLAMVGVWFGFYLSSVLDSYTLGFGFSALAFVILLILLVVFRKPLLVNPIVNAAIQNLIKEYRLPDDKKQQGS